MSKNKESDVQKTTSDVNENTMENPAATRREQLMVEIRSLKLFIATIEAAAGPMKFEDVCKRKDFPTTSERQKLSNPVDVELVVRNELYSLAGVSCRKVGNAFIFGFHCWSIERPKNGYWLKLYNEDNQWQLGCWLMPMSVDVNDILTKFPIESPNDMICFLRECRHHIECYNRRKQQYHELRTFMNTNGYNCNVEADNSFMRITIKLFREACSSPDQSRRIRVDLYYKTNETRSSRMIIDCDDAKELSDRELKELKIYFKRFKELNLKDAAEKILSSRESQSIWRRESEEEAIEIDEDLENEVEAGFMTILEKSSKASKKIHEQSTTEEEVSSNSEGTDEERTENGKKPESGKKSDKKKHASEKINVQKNNKIDKSSKNSSTIVKNLPLKNRNENVVKPSLKAMRIDKNGKLSKNHMTWSSTPLAGRNVPLSKINEDEISEIANETASSEKKSQKKRQFDESDTSPELNEKNDNEQAELLKDLRTAREQNHSPNKQRKKLMKRKSKSPTRTTKVAKK